MSEEIGPVVYEIDVTKKYIFRFEKPLTQEKTARVKDVVETWLNSDQTFLIIGGVKLVKLKVDDE